MRHIVDEAGEIIAKTTDDHTLIGGHHRLVPKSDIRLFFHTALTREAARSRPARLKWSHLLNTSATTLRRYSLNILKELGKV